MFHEIFVQKRKRDGYKKLFIFLFDLKGDYLSRYIYIYILYNQFGQLFFPLLQKKRKKKKK